MAEHAGGNNVHTRKIAEFVSSLTYEAIPAAVRERIKLLILDALGCALYGAHLEWARILKDSLDRLDQSKSCAAWGGISSAWCLPVPWGGTWKTAYCCTATRPSSSTDAAGARGDGRRPGEPRVQLLDPRAELHQRRLHLPYLP